MAAKTFSQNNLSIQTGLDRATVKRMLANVAPDSEATPGRPEYTFATFLAAAVEHRLANSSNNDSSLGGIERDASQLMLARVRITNANARMRERENEIADGKLVEIKHVADSVGAIFSILRENMLGLPGKIADRLTVNCTEDRIAIHGIIYLEVCELLKILASPETFGQPPIAIDLPEEDWGDDDKQ